MKEESLTILTEYILLLKPKERRYEPRKRAKVAYVSSAHIAAKPSRPKCCDRSVSAHRKMEQKEGANRPLMPIPVPVVQMIRAPKEDPTRGLWLSSNFGK